MRPQGFKHSIETIEKIRNKSLGRTFSIGTREKLSKAKIGNNHAFGKKWKQTEEAKQKIREANIGNKYTFGKTWKVNHIVRRPHLREDKNHFWKGGKTKIGFKIRHLPEYRFWRDFIFKRDNYTCLCGRKCRQGDRVILQADHYPIPLSVLIDKFKIQKIDDAIYCKELWNINNGRTLCKECHKKTETYGINKLFIHQQAHIRGYRMSKYLNVMRGCPVPIQPTAKAVGILGMEL